MPNKTPVNSCRYNIYLLYPKRRGKDKPIRREDHPLNQLHHPKVVTMTPKRRLTTTKVRGVASRDQFDGTPGPTSLDTAVISRIYVSFAAHITALEVKTLSISLASLVQGSIA